MITSRVNNPPVGTIFWSEQVVLPTGTQKGMNSVLPERCKKQFKKVYVTQVDSLAHLSKLHLTNAFAPPVPYDPAAETSNISSNVVVQSTMGGVGESDGSFQKDGPGASEGISPTLSPLD